MTFNRRFLIAVSSFSILLGVGFGVLLSEIKATGIDTHYWIEDVSGNWSDGSNWSLEGPDGATCVVAADCVPDADSPTYFDSSSDGDVIIDADLDVGAIYFDQTYAGDFNNSGNHDITTPSFYFAGSGIFTKGNGVYNISNTINLYWLKDTTPGNWNDTNNWSVLGPTAPDCDCYPDDSTDVANFGFGGDGDVLINTNLGIEYLYADSSYVGDFDNSSNYNITLDSGLSWSGPGSFTSGNGTFSTPGSLYFYDGTITFGSGTYSLSSLAFYGGNVNLGSGVFNIDLEFIDDGATVNTGTSTINMDCGGGSICYISGTNTFNNLNVTVASPGKSLLFTEDYIYTINGSLTLQGASASNVLAVGVNNSTGSIATDGSRATVNINSTANINNVTIRDLDNLGTTNPATDFTEASESARLTTRGFFERGPGGVTDNLELWLRSDAFVYEATGNSAEHGDSVSSWIDATTNMTGVSQSVGIQKPVYNLTSWATRQNTSFTPNIFFDGSNDNLTSVDGFYTDSFFIAGRPETSRISSSLSPFQSPLSYATANPALEDDNAGIVFGGFDAGDFGGQGFVMSHCYNDPATSATNWCMAKYFVPDVLGDDINYFTSSFIMQSQKDVSNTSVLHQIYANNYYRFDPLGVFNTTNEAPNNYANYAQDSDVQFMVGAYFSQTLGELGASYRFDGTLSDIISFSDLLSDDDRQKVASYLALKNGVTMTQLNGGQSYVASNDQAYWDEAEAEDAYDNDIAGIGRDDASGLFKTKGQSMNNVHVDTNGLPDAWMIDDVVLFDNPTDLDDLEFMTWANDKSFGDGFGPTAGVSSYSTSVAGYGWTETESPDGYARIGREWMIQESGDVGDVTLKFSDSELVVNSSLRNLLFYTKPYLLVDDDSDLSDATAIELTDQSTYWDLTRNFSNGEYFTLAFRQIDIEFTHPEYSSQEAEGSNLPQIIYNGETLLALTDSILTVDSSATATEGSDYDSYPFELFSLAVGDYTDQIINTGVNINDDLDVESDEEIVFSLSLSTPYFNLTDVNGDGYAVSSATYVILDDDGSDSSGGCAGNCNNDNGVQGCMDPDANNYDPSATEDVGCLYTEVAGCMDPSYDNYNPQATTEDGSCANDDGENPNPVCTGPSCVNPPPDDNSGCTDLLANNYDSSAETDDGSCLYPIEGCTDQLALNFDENAEVNDGSCEYEDEGGDPVVVDGDGDGDEPGSGGGGSTGCDGIIGRIECGGGNVAFIPFLMLLASMVQTMSQYLLNSQTTFSQWIISLFTGKKKRPWGVVFDSFTKEPLDPVYVVLKDALTGQMVQTSITDLDGRYGFLVAKGVYRIEASKMSYQFPSLRLAGKTKDELYDNLYFGGDITVEEDDQVMTHNIPMDPLEANWNEKEKLKRGLTRYYSRFDKFFAVLSEVIFTVGFLFSIFATIVSPIVWNIIVLALYVSVLLFKQFGFDKRGKPGRITVAGQPLVHGVIRLISPETGIEVKKTVTSKDGYYYCLAPKGTYEMEVCSKQPDGTYIPIVKKTVYVKRGVLREEIDIA